MDEKMQKRSWVIAAFIAFFLATTAQVFYRAGTWPFDWLKSLPTFLGDVTALIFWLGAGPLLLSFPFLVPTRSSLFAAKTAAILACLSAVINPIANSLHDLERFGSALDFKTMIINSLTMLGAALPIFLFVVFIPQIIISVLKRRN